MDNQPIRVIIVDDETLIRKGLKALLNEYENIQVIGEAANGQYAVEIVERLKPDVVLIDLVMPVMNGIEAIRHIIAKRPKQRIIVLTGHSGDDSFFQSVKAGAMGYLLKDVRPEELVHAILQVYSGEPAINPAIVWRSLRKMSDVERAKRPAVEFSKPELDVLSMLTAGKTDQEIAEQLVVAEVTVRSHVSRIMKKLGNKNRVQTALYAIQSGLVPSI